MNSKSMAGWIGFAGIVTVILGGLTFCQGLIAIIRDNYYVPTGDGFLVVDVTGWGWIMLFWGIILACVGIGLLGGARWARWTAILLVSVNIFGQLGFLGNTNDLLWALTTLTLNIIVLFALTVRWNETQADIETAR